MPLPGALQGFDRNGFKVDFHHAGTWAREKHYQKDYVTLSSSGICAWKAENSPILFPDSLQLMLCAGVSARLPRENITNYCG